MSGSPPFFVLPKETPLMSARHWQAALLALIVLSGLAGCGTGNYKHSDKDYRPLGDPQAVNHGE
jgi:hypothetical protein